MMNDYIYTAKNYKIRLYIKIRNYIVALFSRTELLKDFCTKNSIDYKPKKDRKYKLPPSYLIQHSELNYLSGIRDKIILSLHELYQKKQAKNAQECQKLTINIKNQRDNIAIDKDRLAKNKKQLSGEKDPLTRIHLQDIINGIETSIANEQDELTDLEVKLKEHETIMKANLASWEKQINIIENIFATRKDSFNRSISRKIVKLLNFTDYKSEYLDYCDSVKAILKGEFNEVKNI